MRSCLRSPLAPGSSSERAMRVSSVMFFSFSSAMVMITYGKLLQRRVIRKQEIETSKGSGGISPRRARGGGCLSSLPLRLERFFCRVHYPILGMCPAYPGQYFVHCFLYAG